MNKNSVKRFVYSLCTCLLFAGLSVTLHARQNNIAVTIERAKGDQAQPKIISAGAAGGTLVFWIDGSDGNKSIYMQTFSADGTPAVSGGSLVSKRSFEIVRLEVAIAPDDGVFLAWQEATTNRLHDVFIFHINPDGTTWPAPVQLGTKTRHQGNPRLAIDDSDGAYVVWEDRPSLSLPTLQNKAIIAQHFDKNAKILWKAVGVDIVRQNTDQNLGDVLTVKEALVVAWENMRDKKVYMRALQVKNGNGLTDAGFSPSNTKAGMSRPRMALADQQNDPRNTDIFVVWQENGPATNKTDLYAQKIDLTGGKKWSSDGKSVNTQDGDQLNHEIIDDGRENLSVVWQDDRDVKFKIYAQRLNSSGGKRFGKAGRALTDGDGSGNQINPKITRNGDRGIYCAWEDDRNGTKDIYAQEVKSSGSLGWKTNGANNVPVTTHDGNQVNVSVYMHPDKRFAIVWEDGRNADIDLYAQNILENGDLDNVTPAIISTPDTTANTGELYAYQVQAIDYDSDLPLVFSLLEAPDWLQIDASTGLVSGTPQANSDAGPLQAKIALQVADNRGAAAIQSYVLAITFSNQPPHITSQPVTSAKEDENYLYQIRFDDPDANDTHTFAGEQLPAWLDLAVDTGLLSGTPTNGDVGATQVDVRVQDQSGASDRQEFTLTVNNTNDPPFFTSTPDTIAYTDSLYQYQVQVGDVDVGDLLTVKTLLKPDWANWDASNRILSGVPPASSQGESKHVLFEVTDLAGEQVLQSYFLHILFGSGSDSTAPEPPAVVFFSATGWVNGQNVTLHWQTPADLSGIKAAYVKIGAAPVNTDDFEVRHEVSAQAGVEDSVRFSISLEGVVPVYLWFEDQAGNVDIGKAVSLTLNVDLTSPTPPVAIFPNAWSREDTVRFAWRKATDTGAGIKNYSITVEPQIFNGVVNPVEIDPTHLETTLVLNLAGRLSKFFRWYVTATDSADNLAPSDTLSFALDATLPLIIHAPPDTILTSQTLTLSANVIDRLSGIASVEVWYRTAGQLTRQEQALARISGDDYSITIPGAAIRSQGFEYVLIAADSAGNRRFYQSNSALSVFRNVVVQSSDLIAPSATRDNNYQMVSVPYSVPGFALQPFFEDNFGSYDDKQWRLLRWQEPVGYLELLSENIEPLRPGRAFWLITRNSQAWKTGRAYSVSTAQKYEIPLNPGWNMISTPFAFDTDWRTVQPPDGVQSVLWEFSGSGYQMEQNVLKSWRGYFIQNTSPNVQILQIAPVAATPTVQKTASRWEEMDWVLQLKAEYQGLQDAANFIGVAANAHDGFDEYEISEPPGIGKTPRLLFPRRHWLSHTIDFATDFRNASAGDLAWQFVVENLSPGALRLSLIDAKAWPDSLAGILYDETTATKRVFSPGANTAFHIEPGEIHRRFTLKLFPSEEVDREISLPQDITLHAAWPNPYKRNSGKNIVFRFALTEPSVVELRIYNILGQEIYRATPASSLPQGEHALTWNARSRFGAPVANGLYFVSIIVNQEQRLQQKILVVE